MFPRQGGSRPRRAPQGDPHLPPSSPNLTPRSYSRLNSRYRPRRSSCHCRSASLNSCPRRRCTMPSQLGRMPSPTSRTNCTSEHASKSVVLLGAALGGHCPQARHYAPAPSPPCPRGPGTDRSEGQRHGLRLGCFGGQGRCQRQQTRLFDIVRGRRGVDVVKEEAAHAAVLLAGGDVEVAVAPGFELGVQLQCRVGRRVRRVGRSGCEQRHGITAVAGT